MNQPDPVWRALDDLGSGDTVWRALSERIILSPGWRALAVFGWRALAGEIMPVPLNSVRLLTGEILQTGEIDNNTIVNRFNKLINTIFNIILEDKIKEVSISKREFSEEQIQEIIMKNVEQQNISEEQIQENEYSISEEQIKKISKQIRAKEIPEQIHGAEKIAKQVHGTQEFSEVTVNSLLYLIECLKHFKNLEDKGLLEEVYKKNQEELKEEIKKIYPGNLNSNEQESGQITNNHEQELNQQTESINQDEKELKDEKELNQHKQELRQYEEKLKQLIKIVFIVSLKKEESRYPKFQLYIPLGKNNSDEHYINLIKFDQEKTSTTIDLDNVDSIARLSLGTSYKNCALLVTKCEDESLKLEGIIRIEKPNLSGILLHVDAPGRLSLTYTCRYRLKKENQEELVQVKLALVESEIRKYSDPVENPIVDTFLFKVAQNICNNIKQTEKKDLKAKISKLEEKLVYNLFPPIINIVKKFFSDILKLAVDLGHGSQFVILTNELEELKLDSKILEYLNIKYCVEQEQDFKKKLLKFIESYVDFLSKFEDINVENTLRYEKRLDSYEKLFRSYQGLFSICYQDLLKSVEKYTELITYLSTVDGSIILNGNLSLIGFGGQTVSSYNPEDNKYLMIEIESTYNGELNSPELKHWDNTEEISKFYLKFLKREKKQWEFNKFGARHQSAARLCHHATELELEPFIFVVSQTGNIREFTKIEHEGEQHIGVLGPLRPL